MDYLNKQLKAQLEKVKNQKVRYAICTDLYDKNAKAYCLVKYTEDKKMEVILTKTTREDTFMEEVENLAKYFNAEIIE